MLDPLFKWPSAMRETIVISLVMSGSRIFRRGVGGGGVLTTCFSHQRISRRPLRTSLEKQLDPSQGIQLLLPARIQRGG